MDHIMGVVMVALSLTSITSVAALQLSLVHSYAHLEGSPASTQGRGASPQYTALLRAHDRRRLAALFPLRGSADPAIAGLYYTEISLGTPPRNYHVDVDTGSDLLWLNCAPCSSCSNSTTIKGVTLQQYDPALSSTDTILPCTDAACGDNAQCTSVNSPDDACAYSVRYGDQSTTQGYIINDVMTFQNSATTTASANVNFGCGTHQGGMLASNRSAVDGIMGFGTANISVPSQLVGQGLVSNMFAHCLKGDVTGGGNIVIGSVTEPGITYTPMVPYQQHYNVLMENIAVNGVNVTDAASLSNPPSNLGVVMDSGTTLAYLMQPAYDKFVAAIEAGAPGAPERIPEGTRGAYFLCWGYSADIATTFPLVDLFFDGGAVMNLSPANYLFGAKLGNGTTLNCLGWLPSTGTATAPGYTILGDIVLKDQLVVYDNSKRMLGWKPFNCSQPIPMA